MAFCLADGGDDDFFDDGDGVEPVPWEDIVQLTTADCGDDGGEDSGGGGDGGGDGAAEPAEFAAAAVSPMVRAAQEMRRLCRDSGGDTSSREGLDEGGLRQECLAALNARLLRVDYPKVLVASPNVLLRTVVRLALVKAGFAAVEAPSVLDHAAARHYHSLDAVLVDAGGAAAEAAQDDIAVLRARIPDVPAVAILDDAGCAAATDVDGTVVEDATPHGLVSQGFDLVVRRPLEAFIEGTLSELLITPARRVAQVAQAAQANYSRISTLLSDVSDRSLYYQVKESARAYRGVVQGSVEAHPQYIRARNEATALARRVEELEEDGEAAAARAARDGEEAARLRAALEAERVRARSLAERGAEAEELRRQSVQVLEERYLRNEGLREGTSLGRRLSHDRHARMAEEHRERAAAQEEDLRESLATAKAHLARARRDRDAAQRALREARAEARFSRCRAEAVEESYVPKGARPSLPNFDRPVYPRKEVCRHSPVTLKAFYRARLQLMEQESMEKEEMAALLTEALEDAAPCPTGESSLSPGDGLPSLSGPRPPGGSALRARASRRSVRGRAGSSCAAVARGAQTDPLLDVDFTYDAMPAPPAGSLGVSLFAFARTDSPPEDARDVLRFAAARFESFASKFQRTLLQGMAAAEKRRKGGGGGAGDVNGGLCDVSNDLVVALRRRCLHLFAVTREVMGFVLEGTQRGGGPSPSSPRSRKRAASQARTPKTPHYSSTGGGGSSAVSREASAAGFAAAATAAEEAAAEEDASGSFNLKPVPLPPFDSLGDSGARRRSRRRRCRGSRDMTVASPTLPGNGGGGGSWRSGGEMLLSVMREKALGLHAELARLFTLCRGRSRGLGFLADAAAEGEVGEGATRRARAEHCDVEALLNRDTATVRRVCEVYELEAEGMRGKVAEADGVRRAAAAHSERVNRACQTGYLVDSVFLSPAALLPRDVLPDANVAAALRQQQERLTVTTFGKCRARYQPGGAMPRRPVYTTRDRTADDVRERQRRSRAHLLQSVQQVAAAPHSVGKSALSYQPVARTAATAAASGQTVAAASELPFV